MANTNYSELITTTLEYRAPEIRDNVSDNIALLKRLKERGNADPYPGGRTILEPIDYADNSTYSRYTGYTTIDITPQTVLSAAEYSMKQAAMSVTMSGTEQLQNSGSKESIFNLIASRVKNAERSFMNALSTDLYSLGTASGGLQINGLQSLVTDAGTGTVGNINSTTFSFWQNYVFDFSTNSLTASASSIQQAMNTAWLNTKRNADACDLILADNNYYNFYWQSLQAIQRIASDTKGQSGFAAVQFMGADVLPDGGNGGDCPSNHMYMLNTNYLHYRPHRDRNMVVIGGDRMSTNQDAFVRLLGWAGNLTCSNRSLQAVLVA
jgi:hypothetical protein